MRMIKSITIIVLTFLCLSCYQKEGNHFFDFNKVEYYSLNINASELINTLDTPRNLTDIEKMESKVVFDDYPEFIEDTSFIAQLGQYDFTKHKIQNEFNIEIKEIFREKFKTRNEFTSCAKVYRDIFIFKKDNKINGIAKICFECSDAYFLGTKLSTTNFGNSGEFGKLREIIRKIKL